MYPTQNAFFPPTKALIHAGLLGEFTVLPSSPQNVNIKDFRSSWADGLAFCAIMHSFLPDTIPYDDLTPEDRRKNFTLAFDAARYVWMYNFGSLKRMCFGKILS
jgi:hypothetical protein